MERCDVVVVGAGMAGASAAWALAERNRVTLLEMEDRPGQHSTARSASVLSETVGHPVVCGLATASRPFLSAPPVAFADHGLLSPRGLLWIGRVEDGAALDALAEATRPGRPVALRVGQAEVEQLVPQLRAAWSAAGGVYEPGAMAIDVDGLLQGFLRGLRERDGRVFTAARFDGAERAFGGWRVRAGGHTIDCRAIVDAAGAWGDVVAAKAGVDEVRLAPLRRTVALVPAPGAVRSWPLAMDVGSRFYAEPESGGLLISPADETPTDPCDAAPEEIDVALAIERVNEATTLALRSVRRAWAGLRTFSPDRVPVVGEAPDAPGFYWLVGQGGAGIKTAPALARVVAALVAGEELPDDIRACGVTADALSPARFGRERARF